jgi:predicted Zn-dependent protease
MIKRLLAICLLAALFAGCETLGQRDIETITTALTVTAKAARPMSESEEYYVGRAVAARILSTYGLLEDRELTEYVNLVGRTVALHSEKPQTYGGYHFAVLDTDEINAFACPGGTVFITKGMLKETRDEEQLAAVLAHEVAHINHRHGVSAIKSSRWSEAVAIIGKKAVQEYGSREFARLVGVFEGSIDDVFKTLVVKGYSRKQELEADRGSLRYMSRAGYSPSGLLGFLERFKERQRTSQGGMLSTHPGTRERISSVKSAMPASTTTSEFVDKRAMRFSNRAGLRGL